MKNYLLKSDQDNFEEDNPYGYIRYISDNDSEDEITILLPSPGTSNASSVNISPECSTIEGSPNSSARSSAYYIEITKKLPNNSEPRITSLITEDSEDYFDEKNSDQLRLASCPPDFKNSQDSLDFIDKTPSMTSLATVPYCPPIQLDKEDFAKVWDEPEDWTILITEKNLDDVEHKDHQSGLVILPPQENFASMPFASPAVPLLKKENFVTSQEILIPRIDEDTIEPLYDHKKPMAKSSFSSCLPPMFKTEVVNDTMNFYSKPKSQKQAPQMATCLPMLEQNPIIEDYKPKIQMAKVIKTKTEAIKNCCHEKSGGSLPQRNRTYKVEIQARISPPKVLDFNRDTPDLIKNLDKTNNDFDCQHLVPCYSTKNLNKEIHRYESLDDEVNMPMSSLSNDDHGEDSQPLNQHFKTGIYAHWWMKADLQQDPTNQNPSNQQLGTWI